MKTLYWVVGILIIAGVAWFAWGSHMGGTSNKPSTNDSQDDKIVPVVVNPIMHATAVLGWEGDTTLYIDPTGGAEAFMHEAPADIVLVTDIHSDHLSTSTLLSVVGPTTALVVPQAVADLLPAALKARTQVVANGQTITISNYKITGVPMYNLPESPTAPHPKGRGNGYVVERGGYRVYIAGDTSGTPEMRALTDIDLAFVPMNLPYTMGVDEAADAVLAFKPKVVYPYHYRGQDGLSDVGRFKTLVGAGNPNINVVLADWYPAQ